MVTVFRQLDPSRFGPYAPGHIGVFRLAVATVGLALGACTAAPPPVSTEERPCEGDATEPSCHFDPSVAWTRILIDFCGRSPTHEEMSTFRAFPDPFAMIHATLDQCLVSENWRGDDGVLWNLANEKIQPIASVKSGEHPGVFSLGDYDDDYRLFVWSNTGDRDVRDLLLADYFVRKGATGEMETFARTPEEDYAIRGNGGAQVVRQDRRAGMLTTRWFLVKNTMFSAVPRVTAAHAYRSYLGSELGLMEGLHGSPGTLTDYDQKGITSPQCAACHATLDPLTYPFTRYEGLGGGDLTRATGGGVSLGVAFLPFSYSPSRLERFADTDGPHVVDTPEAGAILGQPVANLVEWAGVAANSEEFARKVVLDFWGLLFGSAPLPEDAETVERLTTQLMTVHEYRVERMLHSLVVTEAFGTAAVPDGSDTESRLKARTGDVLAWDLAVALDLPRGALCRELGLYDCFEDAHRIPLGGLDPYVLGVRTRDPLPSLTAPVVLERAVLAACTERARQDFEHGGTGLFAPLVKSGSRDTLEQVAAKAITKLLRRQPAAGEVALFADFESNLIPGPTATRDWAIGICVALGTHDEAVFY